MQTLTIDGRTEFLVDDVISFYDRVRMFVGRSTDGIPVIASLVLEDRDSETWYIVALSPGEAIHLGAGRIDLWTAFMGDGSKDATIITVQGAEESVVQHVASADLDGRVLPRPGIKLPSPLVQADAFLGTSDVRAIAKLTGPEDIVRAPAPRAVAKMLTEFVEMIAIVSARSLDLPVGRRGALSKDVWRRLPMRTLGITRSSFGVAIEFGEETPQAVGDVRDNPTAQAIVEALSAVERLLVARSTRELVASVFQDYGPRFARHYRQWLEAASSADSGVGLEWGAARLGSHEASIDRQALPHVLQAVRAAYTEIAEGTLRGVADILMFDVSRRRRRFVLQPTAGELYDDMPDDGPNTIGGTVVDEIAGVQVPLYQAEVVVHRTLAIDVATGSERTSWTLEAIEGGSPVEVRDDGDG